MTVAVQLPMLLSTQRRRLRQAALESVMFETNYTHEEVARMLSWLKKSMKYARRNENRVSYPENEIFYSPLYVVFEAVIKYESVSSYGSAHAAIEQYLLLPRRNEVAIRHDIEYIDPCDRLGFALFPAAEVRISIVCG